MAKLKGPLFSLGASQQLGKSLVYFGWKGLDVVREYVVPANPKTTDQTTQRGYLTNAVAHIHAIMGDAVHPLTEADKSAYALWASAVQSATTWFNQVVRNCIDQLVAAKTRIVYSHGISNEAVDQLTPDIWDMTEASTAGDFWYGTSKTSLINSIAAAYPAANHMNADITPLVTGTKYYWQFRPTAPAGAIGANSGIYHGTPL